MPKDPRTDDAAETPLMPLAWRWPRPTLDGAGGFVLVFALVLGLQAGAVMALNVAVDPRAEFGTGLLPPLVADHASMRVHLLDTVGEDPRTLILGNSRTETITTEDLAPLGHAPAFNFAIGGGSAWDAVTIYRFMDARGYPLEQVVYGVGLMQLQNYKGINHKVHNVPELARHSEAQAAPPGAWDQALASIDHRYTWDSLRSLAMEVSERPQPGVRYTQDGAVIRLDLEQELEDGTFDADAWVARDFDRIEDKLAERHGRTKIEMRPLELLVEEARHDDVTVRLFIPPMHPDLEDALATTSYQEDYLEMRQALIGICQPGVHVHDLHSIGTFGGREDRFYDAWHAFGENHRLVAQALTDPLLDLCAT